MPRCVAAAHVVPMAALKEQVQNTMDECRMLILGG